MSKTKTFYKKSRRDPKKLQKSVLFFPVFLCVGSLGVSQHGGFENTHSPKWQTTNGAKRGAFLFKIWMLNVEC
jgi:hypothetical protein